MKLLNAFALASCLAPAVLADFATGSWPAPSIIASDISLVTEAFGNITTKLQEYIHQENKNGSTSLETVDGISNLTFSLGLFSLHDNEASRLLQFHYTADEIAKAGNGTNRVDGDSIYRVASVTKVLTVLSGLLQLTPGDWDRPLDDIFPVLTEYQNKHPGGSAAVNWTAVTPRNLAAQISGVPRDGFPSLNELELLGLLGKVDTTAMGLPPANESDPLQNPPCVQYLLNNSSDSNAGGGSGMSLCPITPYLESVSNRPPAFDPWTSPGYANNGFSLLGMAIENITSKVYELMVPEVVFDPLYMSSSYIDTPPKSEWNRSVIPGDTPQDYFDISAGVFAASGAASSTLNDLARLGRGILNSTLLSPAETRRWLKPVSFTGRLQYAVGAPWEIHRYTLPNNKVVDMYTKSGDSGAYSAFFVLLPDYDAGFTLLSASSTLKLRFEILAGIADVVTNQLVPALYNQAAVEAMANYAGTYVAGNSSITLIVNQTATYSTLETPVGGPGLVISNWTSNGTDILNSEFTTYTGKLPYRLVPSIRAPANKPSFRLLTPADEPSAQLPIGSKLFSGPGFVSSDWVTVDALTYGGIGTTLFQFEVGDDGKADSVTPSAFREKLLKVELK